MEDPSPKDENRRVLKVLEDLKQASHELQTHPSPKSAESSLSAIEALIEHESDSEDPILPTLAHNLSILKSLVETLQESGGYSLRKFLTRRAKTHSISRVAGSIESEIQAWIDRECIESLIEALNDRSGNEDELVRFLSQFEDRISQGFERDLQDLVLKSRVFSELQSVLFDPQWPTRVGESSAFCMAALIRFNKDVFGGQVNMAATTRALLSIASIRSITVLSAMIRSIRSPFVDEIEYSGEIPRILAFLDSKDLDMKVSAVNCVFEIGYFGRKEAVEAMLQGGLVKMLVALQRSELGGDLIDIGRFRLEKDENAEGGTGQVEEKQRRSGRQKKSLEEHPFASCVARFAVQLEVGEGLRQREKRAFKQGILERVREAAALDAEAATIIAEVLWGSSP